MEKIPLKIKFNSRKKCWKKGGRWKNKSPKTSKRFVDKRGKWKKKIPRKIQQQQKNGEKNKKCRTPKNFQQPQKKI